MENLLRKHSKALYMAFGIMLFAVLIAALFYATNYANIRIFYTIGNGGTILISDVTENAEIAGETNQTLFAYFNNFSQGINMDTFKMTIFNFQHDLSNFNTLIVWFAIVGIIAFAALLILGNHNRNIYYKSNLIGGIVLGYIWNSIFNAILKNYGTTLVNDAKYGFWGLIILMSWQLIGYMMIIYIAGLQNVPTELKEAADIDGATWWQKLTKITIPMVMPSITICMFLSLSNCFKLFDQNLSLTNGAPMRKTSMLALDIYNTFYGSNNTKGVGQAKAVLFFIIVATISLVQLYATRRKEVEQ